MYVPPQALGCVCDSCSEGNCSIDLTGRARNVRVLNLDCVRAATRSTGRIADCAILWNDREIFAVVELKGGQSGVNVNLVVRQIQAGVSMMERLAEDQHVADFYPILMYRGRDPTKALGSSLIEFRGQRRRIILMECGSRLRSITGL